MKALTTSVILVALSVAVPASAGHDDKAKYSFWAFSADGTHALLFIEDENRGPMLGVKKIGKQAWVLRFPTNGVPPASFLQQPPLARFRFVDGGVKGPDSPNGWAKIVGTAGPKGFQLFVTNGAKMQPMFTLAYRADPTTGQLATAEVKEIAWSTSGKSAAIIVHQSVDSAYGLDLDQVVTFSTAYFLRKLGPPK